MNSIENKKYPLGVKVTSSWDFYRYDKNKNSMLVYIGEKYFLSKYEMNLSNGEIHAISRKNLPKNAGPCMLLDEDKFLSVNKDREYCLFDYGKGSLRNIDKYIRTLINNEEIYNFKYNDGFFYITTRKEEHFQIYAFNNELNAIKYKVNFSMKDDYGDYISSYMDYAYDYFYVLFQNKIVKVSRTGAVSSYKNNFENDLPYDFIANENFIIYLVDDFQKKSEDDVFGVYSIVESKNYYVKWKEISNFDWISGVDFVSVIDRNLGVVVYVDDDHKNNGNYYLHVVTGFSDYIKKLSTKLPR